MSSAKVSRSKKDQWFVHVHGETMGPLPKEAIALMLRQNRLQFTEFIWKSGFPDWMRIYEVEDFNANLPTHPKVPIPNNESSSPTAAPFNEDEPEQEQEAPSENTNPKIHVNTLPPETAKPHKVQRFPKIRRFARVPLDALMVTTDHGSFKVINVSVGGLFLQAKTPLPVGTDLKFKLDAKAFGKTLEMTAVVIRHAVEDEQIGFAVEFTRVNPAYKRIIEEYVDHRTKPQKT